MFEKEGQNRPPNSNVSYYSKCWLRSWPANILFWLFGQSLYGQLLTSVVALKGFINVRFGLTMKFSRMDDMFRKKYKVPIY